MIYHTKLCHSGQTVLVYVGVPKYGEHWGPVPWDGGVIDP